MQDRLEIKSDRLLTIYMQLTQGKVLKKQNLAEQFHVSLRSIQRDIEQLRGFFAEQTLGQDIIYDRQAKGYYLMDSLPRGLTNSEILAVCKILLESRSMTRGEIVPILDKLVDYCVPAESRQAVQDLLANEKFLYVEPHHGQEILPGLWELGQAVQQHKVLEIEYQKLKGKETVKRVIEPVGLMFSEFYFYLAAFIQNIDKQEIFENPDDLFPTIYRVDRLRSFRETGDRFYPPYAKRFQEGEFRKRVQFMYGGRLQTVKFKYIGPSLEAVLDRLPTAVIVSEDEDGWIISAEVFGKGIDMWLRSQGDYVKLWRGDQLET